MVGFRKQAIIIGLFLALVFGTAEGWGATIHVKLDRSQVSLNESFTLVYEAEGSLDEEPDFSPIEQHFEILQRSEGSRMEIINGDFSRKKQWTLTLMGKQAGFFTIPPIAFGKDQSPGVRIDIGKAAAPKTNAPSESLFLEVSAEPQSGYVQSQFIYTVRLYRSVNLLSAQLSEPSLSDADAVIEQIGENREFETTRDGKPYRVVERRYGIFPQQSGSLTIEPLTFAGQLASRSRGAFSPFPGGGAIKRLRSEKIELEVKPVPQDKITGRWLPAKNLRIREIWPETPEGATHSQVGEPITWTITLQADGLTAAQLPEIEPQFSDDFKTYPDQPSLKTLKKDAGITGIRQEKIALIPTRPGSLLLPAIEVPWWNTGTNQMEIARLPQRHIEVTPAEAAQQPPASIPLQQAPFETSPKSSDERPMLQVEPGHWFWVSFILAICWAVTLLGWWQTRSKARKQMHDAKDRAPELPDTSQVKKQLKKACAQNEATAAKEALLSWGRILWPGRPVSLGEIGNRVVPPLSTEIKKLNAVLYSQEPTSWQEGSALWEAFEQEVARHKEKVIQKPGGLVPLYP